MSGNAKLLLKKIVGCLLLVFALHYVLDEPHRTTLIRAAFEQFSLTRGLLSQHAPPDPYVHVDAVQNDQWLLHNASFERWEVQPYPMPNTWFSTVTISVSAVVKKETEIVQHGRSAVRLEHDGIGHCGNVRQELPHEVIPSLRGRRLKFSAWALSAISGAPCVHIDDGTDRSSACLQNPSLAWVPVTVERMISPEATRVLLIIDISREPVGEIVAGVYVDNASLAESLPSSEAPGATAVPAPSFSPSPEQR